MDNKFNKALFDICSQDFAAVIVTIVQVKGSTPRKAGAKMLILPDGQTFGTIGGGCGEAEVRREALHVLDDKRSKQYMINMTNDMAEDEGMVCGGLMEVFIDYLGSDSDKDKTFFKEYLAALKKGSEPLMVTVIHSLNTAVPSGKKFFITSTGREAGELGLEHLNQIARDKAQQIRSAGKCFILNISADFTIPETNEGMPYYQLLFEPNPAPVELLILGGGHIALPLANMAKMLGYRVTVVDDRPSFANVDRFALADRVICNDFSQAIKEVEIHNRTFVVIVTRGHRHDRICLEGVISQPAFYMGMIGSRRRVRALLGELRESGTPEGRLESIHTPIGLDIGAETPEEIAVSILAEIIKINRGGKAQSLKIN